jgi:hypothetical protein
LVASAKVQVSRRPEALIANIPAHDPRVNLIRAAVLPALATALVWMPQVLQNNSSESIPLVVAALYFITAPTVALLVNWRWPGATNADRAVYAALPQVVVSPGIIWLDLQVEVLRGYLERGTSEEAMSFGLGIFLAVIVGIVLMLLVSVTGRLGAWLGRGPRIDYLSDHADSDSPDVQSDDVHPGRIGRGSKRSVVAVLSATACLFVCFASLVVLFPGLVSVFSGTEPNKHCSQAEQQAMSEFPHYGGADPEWEPNRSGGCSTSYAANATPAELQEYYRAGLRERGWVVFELAGNTTLMYLQADREGLNSYLMFASSDLLDPSREENAALREKLLGEMTCSDCGTELKPGQTRVSISGRDHR